MDNYNDYISNISLLLEGGSYGNIQKLFDIHSLTLKEFKKYIHSFIDGSIVKTKPSPEIKTDGQNLMISYKDDSFIFARNKSHLKGFGSSSLSSIEEVEKHLKSIPEPVIQSFANASEDMISCLSKIDHLLLKQIFQDGAGWLSFEIINPETKNVFDYGIKSLYLQSVMIVNENGIQMEENKDFVITLFDEIEKSGLEHQKNFVIRKMVKAVFNPNPNLQSDKEYVDKYFEEKIYQPYDVKETNTIKDFLYAWWKRYIIDNSPFEFADDDIEVLTDRFVSNNIKIRLVDFEKNYGKDVMEWIKKVDDNNKKINYISNEPIRFIYDEAGYRSINNLKTHLSSNPEKTIRIFKSDLKEKIQAVRKLNKDDKDYERFNEIFVKINKHRPIETLTVADEGYTFFINGKIFKVTGYFSHINQLFGIGKY